MRCNDVGKFNTFKKDISFIKPYIKNILFKVKKAYNSLLSFTYHKTDLNFDLN